MSYVNVCKIGNIYLNTSGVFDLGYTLNKEKILTLYMLSTTWKHSALACKLFNPETVLVLAFDLFFFCFLLKYNNNIYIAAASKREQ
jgi:hypothetical protein